ncbi:uncharacterized protein KY384_007142 [Bacidia gigantensis]|uniref:uncharacterized protein n=1 Tax=Bacidia gigantensis TaxID=2732470 RepID=UPI001D04C840|nr:uncharacterized protein KY384_007142 [Bacidia gigantensis]KAG8528225.1 hypothetical protein KY384_007142 [Bacidia gigantensis]
MARPPLGASHVTDDLAECSHLASGQYRGKLASLRGKYPSLKYPDLQSPVQGCGGRVVSLEFSKDNDPIRKDFTDPSKLRLYIEAKQCASSTERITRRLFLVEGLEPGLMSVVGHCFNIDPTLVVRQQRTAHWEPYHKSGNTPLLPSLLEPSRSFHVPYYELHYYPEGLPDKLDWRCADSGRQINSSRMPGTFDRVGIADRKVSYWSQKRGDGWDAILFLDPPVREVFLGVKSGRAERLSTPNEPYQGGYLDFMKFSSLDDACRTRGPTRESVLEDVCYYFFHHASCIDIQDDPMICTLFLKKIVASNYMVLIEYVKATLSTLEWSLSRQNQDISEIKIAWAEQRWSDLQSWSRRCSEYCENMESIIDSLRIPLFEADASGDWAACEKDFHLINRKLIGLKQRANALISSLTGLAGILGNRQTLKEASRSLHEAKSVKILTFLGMMFAPLFLTSGIFSMSEKYLPGGSFFWVYIAVAVPLVLLVFGAVSLINMGYGADGEWSSKEFRQTLRSQRGNVWGSFSHLPQVTIHRFAIIYVGHSFAKAPKSYRPSSGGDP